MAIDPATVNDVESKRLAKIVRDRMGDVLCDIPGGGECTAEWTVACLQGSLASAAALASQVLGVPVDQVQRLAAAAWQAMIDYVEAGKSN